MGGAVVFFLLTYSDIACSIHNVRNLSMRKQRSTPTNFAAAPILVTFRRGGAAGRRGVARRLNVKGIGNSIFRRRRRLKLCRRLAARRRKIGGVELCAEGSVSTEVELKLCECMQWEKIPLGLGAKLDDLKKGNKSVHWVKF